VCLRLEFEAEAPGLRAHHLVVAGIEWPDHIVVNDDFVVSRQQVEATLSRANDPRDTGDVFSVDAAHFETLHEEQTGDLFAGSFWPGVKPHLFIVRSTCHQQ